MSLGSSSHLGQRAVALRRRGPFARALGDVLPLVRIVVDGLRSGAARAGAGGAVVLAGERNAIALVGAGLDRRGSRLGGGGEGGGKRAGERGGGDGGSGVHRK